MREGYVEVRTHRGWIRIGYRNNKQLHRYLYNNWKTSSELKLKLSSGKILVYLTLTKAFPSTGPHAARVKLVIPSLGATPLTEIQIFGNTIKHR